MYRLTADAWKLVQRALPYFKVLHLLTDQGVRANDHRYRALELRILWALGISSTEKHSAEAYLRICPAAQYARGKLVAEPLEDGGSLLQPPRVFH